METYMSIEVEFTDNSFYATAIIEPDKSLDEKTFTFTLNNNLSISEIMCNGKKTKYEKVSEEKPSFHKETKRKK